MTSPPSATLVLLLACFVPLGACGADAADPEALFEPGPHVVGFRQATLTYARGGSGEPRELALHAWYPAASGSTEPPASYVTGGVIRIRSQSALSEPAVASGGPFPLVVYSHGGGGEAQHAYPYGELLASHGFVVVSVTHAGTATLDSAPTRLERWALDRPSDIAAALDWLEAPTDEWFEGLVTTDRVMLVGYSLGAYTVFAASGAQVDLDQIRAQCSTECELLVDGEALAEGYGALMPDERVVALVAQAPGASDLFVAGSLGGFDIPVMLQSGLLDISTPHATSAVPLWESRDRVGDVWVDMPTGAHMSFIPSCRDVPVALLALVRPTAIEDGCAERFISVDDSLPGLAAYVMGFARIHLLGDMRWREVLSGPPLRPGFTITAR